MYCLTHLIEIGRVNPAESFHVAVQGFRLISQISQAGADKLDFIAFDAGSPRCTYISQLFAIFKELVDGAICHLREYNRQYYTKKQKINTDRAINKRSHVSWLVISRSGISET